MTQDNRQVAVIDDDPSFREALVGLIRSFGFDADGFDSPQAFLEDPNAAKAECLILDVNMPKMSGLQLQRCLTALGRHRPIIVMTARLDDRIRAEALHDGALMVLEKPCEQGVFLKYLKLGLRIFD
jgi:FixJ family two-component response regulator